MGINLLYYNSKEDFENEKESLREIETFHAAITRWPVSDREFCMELKTGDSIFYLHAESSEDRMNWMNEIRRSSRIHIEGYKLKALKFEVAKPVTDIKTNSKKKFIPISRDTFNKSGTLYRKGVKETRTYFVVLKNKSIKYFIPQSEEIFKEIDLLLVQPINEDSIQQVESSIGTESLYFFQLVNTEAGRTELLGSADIEDLQGNPINQKSLTL